MWKRRTESRAARHPWGAIFNSRPLQAESNKSRLLEGQEPQTFFDGPDRGPKLESELWADRVEAGSQKTALPTRRDRCQLGPFAGPVFVALRGVKVIFGAWGSRCELWPLARGFLLRASCVHVLSVWMDPLTHSKPSCRALLAVFGFLSSSSSSPNTNFHFHATTTGEDVSHNPLQLTQSVSMSKARRAWCPSWPQVNARRPAEPCRRSLQPRLLSQPTQQSHTPPIWHDSRCHDLGTALLLLPSCTASLVLFTRRFISMDNLLLTISRGQHGHRTCAMTQRKERERKTYRWMP